MPDSDRPTSEMPVLPHVCQPDKDGWCGNVQLVCSKCGHRGMTQVRGDGATIDVRCPQCGNEGTLSHSAQAFPGTKV